MLSLKGLEFETNCYTNCQENIDFSALFRNFDQTDDFSDAASSPKPEFLTPLESQSPRRVPLRSVTHRDFVVSPVPPRPCAACEARSRKSVQPALEIDVQTTATASPIRSNRSVQTATLSSPSSASQLVSESSPVRSEIPPVNAEAAALASQLVHVQQIFSVLKEELLAKHRQQKEVMSKTKSLLTELMTEIPFTPNKAVDELVVLHDLPLPNRSSSFRLAGEVPFLA
jgi:hypothetical protein